jgi:hypothetical protein
MGSDLRAVDPPPQTHDTDLFVGWVQPEREAEADHWIEFLTDEIAKRLAAPSVPIEGTLRPIGRFEEFGYGYGAPSVATARGKRAPRNKAEVVKYLRGGKMFVFSPGIEKDVFDETKLSDSSSIRTDGVYSWPEVLGYYVDRYDIELPEEFEEHMRANTWTVPQNIDVATLRLPQKR